MLYAPGFVVKAANSEIIDLGTEFAIEISDHDARIEVIDGEAELRGRQHDGRHLLTGDGASLSGTQSKQAALPGRASFRILINSGGRPTSRSLSSGKLIHAASERTRG